MTAIRFSAPTLCARQIRLLAIFILFGLLLGPAHARLDILGTWSSLYPESNADEIGGSGCQLCHASPMGNEPWNAYGWDLRQRINNGFTAQEAMQFSADEDHDGNGVETLDEIRDDFQPGWTEGTNNTFYFSNGSTTTGQLPPAVNSATAIDHPDAVADPIADIPMGALAIELHEVTNGLNAPLKAVAAPGINGSIFVVQQTGKILRVDLSNGEKTVFYDAANDLVNINPSYDERGLLGLAFHPNFATNGRFYTYQSEPFDVGITADFSTMPNGVNPEHRSTVVEYRVSNPSCNSSVSKMKTLITIDQPQSNHNGGDLAFDQQGYLYVSVGDGGSSNDDATGHGVRGNGRDYTNPLGAILRIDVDGSNSANGEYGIPPSNPFLSNIEAVDEIYAYGFRNAFRFSFDSQTGDLYAGDVGQNQVEEINLVTSGGNYGWNWKEGSFGFYDYILPNNTRRTYVSDVEPPSLPVDVIDPIAEYDHDDGISVTGGYVYRGTQVPLLVGRYTFADWNRRLFYLDAMGNIQEFNAFTIDDYVPGFGEDAENELYIVTNDGFAPSGMAGRLLKLQAVGASYTPPDAGDESAQCPPEPPSEDLCVPIIAGNGNIATVCL